MSEEENTLSENTSYATVAEAGTLLAHRAGTDAWNALGEDAKLSALTEASAVLDDLIDWKGVKCSGSQPLGWPRTGAAGRDGIVRSADAVPEEVKRASVEQALYMLDPLANAARKARENGVTGVSGASLSFNVAASGGAPQAVCAAALYALRGLGSLRSGGTLRSGNIVRG